MAFNFDCKLIFWRYLPKSNSGEAVSSSRLTKNHIRACTELIGALLVVQNMHATTGTIAVHILFCIQRVLFLQIGKQKSCILLQHQRFVLERTDVFNGSSNSPWN